MEIIIAFFTIIILILSFIFLIRTKIVGLMGFLLKMSFPLCIILVFSGLLFAPLYKFLADQTLKQAGVYESVVGIDGEINKITEPGGNIIDGLKDLLGRDKEDNIASEKAEDEGLLQRAVYNNLRGLLTLIYRVLAIVIGIVGMIAVVYLSYTIGFAADYVRLQADISVLEKRVEDLERKLK